MCGVGLACNLCTFFKLKLVKIVLKLFKIASVRPVWCIQSPHARITRTFHRSANQILWGIWTCGICRNVEKAHKKGCAQRVVLLSRHLQTCNFHTQKTPPAGALPRLLFIQLRCGTFERSKLWPIVQKLRCKNCLSQEIWYTHRVESNGEHSGRSWLADDELWYHENLRELTGYLRKLEVIGRCAQQHRNLECSLHNFAPIYLIDWRLKTLKSELLNTHMEFYTRKEEMTSLFGGSLAM